MSIYTAKEKRKDTAPSQLPKEPGTDGTTTIADYRPSTVHQRQLRKTMDAHAAAKAIPLQRKANHTGLPDRLKTGIEHLSGYRMDDVKVHYNSGKPAQLQAHAYAQGTDIHLAPGQEKHLPHEAWHVVQQKQGRVKPTMQLKGKVHVNDDAGLEREADEMGAQAFGLNTSPVSTVPSPRMLSLTGFSPIIDSETVIQGNFTKELYKQEQSENKGEPGLQVYVANDLTAFSEHRAKKNVPVIREAFKNIKQILPHILNHLNQMLEVAREISSLRQVKPKDLNNITSAWSDTSLVSIQKGIEPWRYDDFADIRDFFGVFGTQNQYWNDVKYIKGWKQSIGARHDSLQEYGVPRRWKGYAGVLDQVHEVYRRILSRLDEEILVKLTNEKKIVEYGMVSFKDKFDKKSGLPIRYVSDPNKDGKELECGEGEKAFFIFDEQARGFVSEEKIIRTSLTKFLDTKENLQSQLKDPAIWINYANVNKKCKRFNPFAKHKNLRSLWEGVLIHELSHLVAGTRDHNYFFMGRGGLRGGNYKARSNADGYAEYYVCFKKRNAH